MADEMKDIITVGWKKGEADFAVRSTIAVLSVAQMNELRVMTMVAIGVAEETWRRAQEARAQQGSAAATR